MLLFTASFAAADEIVTLPTRDGVKQSFLLLAPASTKPAAVAVLFPGSAGNIQLRTENGQIKFAGGNFLVRSRKMFVDGGVAAAVVDAPSDESQGMDDGFRLGDKHAADIAIVVADLKKRFNNAPVFLVGTSRGSVSAAALGARLDAQVAGTVLTSTMFRPAGKRSNEPGPGLSGFDFDSIRIPALLVHHRDDQCLATPYADAARLAAKRPLITVTGGDSPRSGPCEGMSAHGYLGKEAETVEAIVNWMLKKPYRNNID